MSKRHIQWHLPSKQQIKALPHLLNPREKKLLAVFFAIFLASGIGILLIIDKTYSTTIPADGGSIREGIIGTPNKINPLLAISGVDRDLTDLVYAGLMRVDGKGGLEPELAESYKISEDGLEYTFTLRENLYWHDGTPLTSDDVVFTITTAKNPVINSPKRANWEGVEVKKINERTVRFILKRPYAPFLTNTTLGILPKHKWEAFAPQEFKLTNLNIVPIGAGPYAVASFYKNTDSSITRYTLKAFKKYQPHKPHIKKIVFMFLQNEEELVKAYQNGDIDTMAIKPETASLFDINAAAGNVLTVTTPKLFTVFFNQTASKVLADPSVRNALNAATDREAIIKTVTGGYGTPRATPVFLSLNSTSTIPISAASTTAAETILRKGGWKKSDSNDENIFKKKTKKGTLELKLTLSTSDNPELVSIAKELKRQWQNAGFVVNLEIFELTDFEQTRLRPRDYEALLFGQVVGFRPDPFAFWHSSQRADPGYNIALYANPKADKLIEAIRGNISEPERKKNLEALAVEIQKDMPALFLYSPVQLYIVDKNIKGIDIERLALASERFTQVEKWYKNTRNVWNVLLR